MPETATKPVNATTAPAKTAAERLAKIENPQTIKDYFVNNLLDAADRVAKSYNGKAGDQVELMSILKTQALNSKENSTAAFFDERFNETFEKGLAAKGPDVAKTVAAKAISDVLPQVRNFPLEKKVAEEFTAIVTASLNSAIESRSSALGQTVAKTPAAATQVIDQKVLAEAEAAVGKK